MRRPNAWYRDLIDRIREVVDRDLPPDANILVVSNGDEELLKLGEQRRGWHFPQMEDGTYAGHHPGDSAEAVAHFQALRARGAEYILFPETALWWLEYYGELRDMLAREYGEAARRDGTCVVFGRRTSVETPSRPRGIGQVG
jgi:hypothetical protein